MEKIDGVGFNTGEDEIGSGAWTNDLDHLLRKMDEFEDDGKEKNNP